MVRLNPFREQGDLIVFSESLSIVMRYCCLMSYNPRWKIDALVSGAASWKMVKNRLRHLQESC
jgi:hypothetical protein